MFILQKELFTVSLSIIWLCEWEHVALYDTRNTPAVQRPTISCEPFDRPRRPGAHQSLTAHRRTPQPMQACLRCLFATLPSYNVLVKGLTANRITGTHILHYNQTTRGAFGAESREIFDPI